VLKIISSKQLADSMKLAQETKTEDQLIRWLLWLDEWHTKDKTELRIMSDLPSSPGSISWYAHRINHDGKVEDQAFYNGGLIFHRSANEWSIHS
jgi:hypothetical protein